MERLARELDLGTPDMPWHNQRDNIAELAGWLSMVTGSIGKIGQDLLLMCQNEVGEILIENDSAGSSTMPNKSNPIAVEMLMTSAMINTSLLANMHQGLIVDHERATVTWQLEWLTLPQMFACAISALNRAIRILDTMLVDQAQMLDNLKKTNGLVLAEAATFLLAESMPRLQAQQLVMAACQRVRNSELHLVDALQELVDIPVDWDTLDDPNHFLGSANQLIDRMLARIDSR